VVALEAIHENYRYPVVIGGYSEPSKDNPLTLSFSILTNSGNVSFNLNKTQTLYFQISEKYFGMEK